MLWLRQYREAFGKGDGASSRPGDQGSSRVTVHTRHLTEKPNKAKSGISEGLARKTEDREEETNVRRKAQFLSDLTLTNVPDSGSATETE